jgi:hypothetical protein
MHKENMTHIELKNLVERGHLGDRSIDERMEEKKFNGTCYDDVIYNRVSLDGIQFLSFFDYNE